MFLKFSYAILLVVFSIIVFKITNTFLLPHTEVAELVNKRADFVRYEETFDQAYGFRELGMKTELNLWLNGTIIWGVGASYPPALARLGFYKLETGALNHVAFSSYLAHFGIIGLFVYGFLLPFLSIKVGKRYYLSHQQDYCGMIAVMGMALALFDVFTLLSSNLYLISVGQVPGLIYGALWGLSRTLEVAPSRVASGYANIHKPQYQWLPGPVK